MPELLDKVAIARANMSPEERARADFLQEYIRREKSKQITLKDLMIQDEKGNIVPLIWNPVQRELMREMGIDPDADILPNLKNPDAPWRKRILKARRGGVSTAVFAIYFIDTYNNRERMSVSMAHDQESADGLFGIVHRFLRFLPEHKKLKIGRANVREIYFPETNSRFFVTTAARENALSGLTVDNLHKSEYFKWKGTESDIRLLNASLNIATRWGNIIEESTAFGLNFGYHDWQASMREENDYAPIFIPWYKDDRNKIRWLEGEERVFSKQELEWKEQFKLLDTQIKWYRAAQKEHKELVKQEYPFTPAEAFLSTGNPYFNREWLMKESARLLGAVPWWEENAEQGFIPAGRLRVWIEPNPDHQYVIGADVSEGITDDGDHDYSTAVVRDVATWEQVATYRGRCDPKDFGDFLDWLGKEFSGTSRWGATIPALLIPERNNHGLIVVNRLEELNYRNLYRHKVMRTYANTQIEETVAGYPKTQKTKILADDGLAVAIQEAADGKDSISYSDPELVEELIHYVKKPGGKAGAEGGGHDDLVTADALSVYGLSLMGRGQELRTSMVELESEEPLYGRTSRIRR